jgi:hypothetical protein
LDQFCKKCKNIGVLKMRPSGVKNKPAQWVVISVEPDPKCGVSTLAEQVEPFRLS